MGWASGFFDPEVFGSFLGHSLTFRLNGNKLQGRIPPDWSDAGEQLSAAGCWSARVLAAGSNHLQQMNVAASILYTARTC